MANLPSYQEATSRPDWLVVAAPYVDTADYHSLCLVNRHFWAVFAPRLWVDILRMVRIRGLDPSDGKRGTNLVQNWPVPADSRYRPFLVV
jgi:hypothetical protein